jgi:hypothetical protein
MRRFGDAGMAPGKRRCGPPGMDRSMVVRKTFASRSHSSASFGSPAGSGGKIY